MNHRVLSAVLVFAVLTACGGGGGGGVMPPPQVGVPVAPAVGTAAVHLVVPSGTTSAAIQRKRPAFVSPATQSASIAVGGVSTILDLSPSSLVCVAQAAGRVCSANIQVSYGSVTFTVTTYDAAPINGSIPASAHVLGRSSVTQNVSASSGAIGIAVDAVVNGFGTLPSFMSSPADGTTHTYGFVLNPVDFDNAPIANHVADPFANPLSVSLVETGGSGHAQLLLNGVTSGSSAMLHSATDVISMQYDGGGSPGYSALIAFAASGVAASTTTLSPLFVTSTSSAFVNHVVSLTGAASSVPFTISQVAAPAGTAYSASATACTNIASATTPTSSLLAPPTFTVTGGTAASGGGCAINVSDGISTLSFGVYNAPPSLPTPTPTATPSPTPMPTATPTATPVPTPTPTPTPTPGPPYIYVNANNSGASLGAIEYYPVAQATGSPSNLAPLMSLTTASTISGSMAIDQAHNILWNMASTGQVYGYATGTSGFLVPQTHTLNAGLGSYVAVDPSGNVYVENGGFPNFNVTIFAYGGTVGGTTLHLAVTSPIGLAVDASGNMYVADAAGSISVISNPGTSAGVVSATVTRTITPASPPFVSLGGIAVDSLGRVYAIDYGAGKIYIFAAGTTNAASSAPIETIYGASALPYAITSPFSILSPYGMAFDSSNNLYVSDYTSIQIFSAASITGALGGTLSTSSSSISGASTTLTYASGIAVH